MINILDSIALQRKWQIQWRELLGLPTVDMPEDIMSDFALHNDIWALGVGKLEACFSVFPSGLKILERANAVRSIVGERKKDTADDALLLGQLDNINLEVEKVLSTSSDEYAVKLNDEKKCCSKNVIYNGDEKRRLALFYNAISPTIALDDILRDLFEKHFGLEGYCAYEFLSDPLYSIARSSDIAHGILWAALKDEYHADPYQSVFDHYRSYAQAGWSRTDNEMFVFVKDQ